MTVIPIDFGTPEYDEMVAIRYDVLRKPLGLEFTIKQLEKEWEDIHFACYSERSEMLGCLILTKVDEHTLKMRQVAVKEKLQGAGVGKALVEASEAYAQINNFTTIELNARNNAIPFYERLGYEIVSDTFTEVGIEHRKMKKKWLTK
jgi:predicted GNAT family N-acyltransferase